MYKLDFKTQMYYNNIFKILKNFQILWLDRSYKYPTKKIPMVVVCI